MKPLSLATDEQLRSLAQRMSLPNELWLICQSRLPLLSAERMKIINHLMLNHVVGFV